MDDLDALEAKLDKQKEEIEQPKIEVETVDQPQNTEETKVAPPKNLERNLSIELQEEDQTPIKLRMLMNRAEMMLRELSQSTGKANKKNREKLNKELKVINEQIIAEGGNPVINPNA